MKFLLFPHEFFYNGINMTIPVYDFRMTSEFLLQMIKKLEGFLHVYGTNYIGKNYNVIWKMTFLHSICKLMARVQRTHQS